MRQDYSLLEELIVYHRVHEPFHGTTLHPLNRLRTVAPDLYDVHAAKYAWREKLMESRIPPLDCLWNDVLHFSPVHPAKISEALVEAGRPPLEGKFFAVPLSKFDPVATAVLLSSAPPLSSTTYTAQNQVPIKVMGSDVLRFIPWHEATPADIDLEVPEHTRAYYAFEVAHGRRPLLFNGISHIFYRGSLSIEGLEVIAF